MFKIFCSLSGKDYPERMVIHQEVSKRNRQWMKVYAEYLEEISKVPTPSYCHSSTAKEVYKFLSVKALFSRDRSEIPMDVAESSHQSATL